MALLAGLGSGAGDAIAKIQRKSADAGEAR